MRGAADAVEEFRLEEAGDAEGGGGEGDAEGGVGSYEEVLDDKIVSKSCIAPCMTKSEQESTQFLHFDTRRAIVLKVPAPGSATNLSPSPYRPYQESSSDLFALASIFAASRY